MSSGLKAGEDFILDRCESVRQTKNSLLGIEEFICGTENLNERGQSNCETLRPYFCSAVRLQITDEGRRSNYKHQNYWVQIPIRALSF